jgi:phage repressor protein C with HTH and peptisase S24 domain
MAFCGMLKADKMSDPDDTISDYIPVSKEHSHGGDYAVAVAGWSMFPELKPGDSISVKRTHAATRGQIVVAKHPDGDVYIKRFVGRQGKKVHLRSDNPEYSDMIEEGIEIVGVVVWSQRVYG